MKKKQITFTAGGSAPVGATPAITLTLRQAGVMHARVCHAQTELRGIKPCGPSERMAHDRISETLNSIKAQLELKSVATPFPSRRSFAEGHITTAPENQQEGGIS